MRLRSFAVPAVTLIAATLVTQPNVVLAQQTVEQPVFRVNAVEIEIGGQMQMQFNTSSVDEVPDTEWLLRRVRLEAKVRVNDLVSGKIQPDFAGDRVRLKDAYLLLNFSPAVQVLAGKAYRPFGLLVQTSSKRILPIERGARIRGITPLEAENLVEGLGYGDRDIGLQLMGAPAGAPLGFAYAIGVFDGPQDDIGNQDARQYAARATIAPIPDLRFGGGWSSREFPRLLSDEPLEVELERGHAWEVDVEYGGFNPGFHLLGEIVTGDADPAAEDDFNGAQVWLAYRSLPVSTNVSALEPVFRASYGDVDTGSRATLPAGGTLLTPGLNIYFGPLNRLMLNYDVWTPDEGDTETSFKAMFQLAF